jgi:tetratricopeptide (TPR) repeat protein
MYRTLLISLILTFSGFTQLFAQTDPQSAASNARVQSVGKLITTSKAAKQIEMSANPEAMAKRDEARALYRQAVEAFNAGDQKSGNELLTKSSRTMFEAVRMAGTEEALKKKHERDYQTRLESVVALTDTHTRISQEKGTLSENGALLEIVDNKLAEAKSLHDAKKLVEARKVLDEAYAAAKMAIEQVRGGETLVRTLHFETKEQEYHYEVDRNDTHRMLVDMLLQEKIQANASLKTMVEKFMDKAAKTRATAEQQAASGDYEAAVETMERATKEIVRAIRSAGIYIPG